MYTYKLVITLYLKKWTNTNIFVNSINKKKILMANSYGIKIKIN